MKCMAHLFLAAALPTFKGGMEGRRNRRKDIEERGRTKKERVKWG
jgi:hypothetical protein